MPYSRSLSRTEFDDKTSRLLKGAREVSLKKNNNSYFVQQLVFKAVILKSSATLEEYIKTILSDWMHMLRQHEKCAKDAPTSLILYDFAVKQLPHFKNHVVNGDEKTLISKIKNAKINMHLLEDSKIKDLYISDHIITEKKYPSQKNISTLFYRFGIEDVFKELNKKGRKNYKNILQSFSDIRTELAHISPSRDITYVDITHQMSSLKDFVKTLDRVMYSHICKKSGVQCWKDNNHLALGHN